MTARPEWKYEHVSEYLKFVKTVRAFFQDNPDGNITIYRFGVELNQESFREEFRKALNIRINLKGGLNQQTRKYSDRYQTELIRDARAIRNWSTKRYICRSLGTKDLKKRFAFILFNED